MRTCRVWFACCSLVFLMAGPGLAIDFNEISRFNVFSTSDDTAPEFIGSNPSAVGWDGSRLFVAGNNNADSFGQDVGIVEILNATTTGIVDPPSYGVPFGIQQFTPQFRGYTALDLSADGSSLAFAYDDGNDGTSERGIFNTSDGSKRWFVNKRGSSGATFDPGFNGAGGPGAGTAFGQFGSGRRLLNDTTTGAVLFDETDGMIWYAGVGGTLVRDMDFDPVTGDIYVRHGNQLSKAIRTGDNAADFSPGIISAETQADFQTGQNLSFLSDTAEGDLIIYNSKETSSEGQLFADVIRVVDSLGTPVTANFNFLNGDTPADAIAYYDFDFDPASQTLALLDFFNRNVHIFEVRTGGGVDGDFDNDGFWTCDDINALSAAIASGSTDLSFDMNGDQAITLEDITDPGAGWLAVGGANNPGQTGGSPFLNGDANLSGGVDGSDFGIWNGNKFSQSSAWCNGDFNASGGVDGSDFGVWNINKFQNSGGVSAVPEPFGLCGLLAVAALGMARRRT